VRVCAATAVGGHVLVWGPRARVESGEMRTGPGARCCALQERPGQRLSDGGGVQTPGAESSAPGRGMNATVNSVLREVVVDVKHIGARHFLLSAFSLSGALIDRNIGLLRIPVLRGSFFCCT